MKVRMYLRCLTTGGMENTTKKEYITRYTEEECEVADSIIFTAISGGFG